MQEWRKIRRCVLGLRLFINQWHSPDLVQPSRHSGLKHFPPPTPWANRIKQYKSNLNRCCKAGQGANKGASVFIEVSLARSARRCGRYGVWLTIQSSRGGKDSGKRNGLIESHRCVYMDFRCHYSTSSNCKRYSEHASLAFKIWNKASHAWHDSH